MKRNFLLVVLMALAGDAWCQNIGNTSDLMSVPGIVDAVASAAKNTKAIGFMNLNGDLGTGLFLPIRTFVDTKNIFIGTTTVPTTIKYVSIGIAGTIKQKEHFRPNIPTMINASAILRRIEGLNNSYTNHIQKTILPDIWTGLNCMVPFPGDVFTWKNNLNVGIAMGW